MGERVVEMVERSVGGYLYPSSLPLLLSLQRLSFPPSLSDPSYPSPSYPVWSSLSSLLFIIIFIIILFLSLLFITLFIMFESNQTKTNREKVWRRMRAWGLSRLPLSLS